MLTELVQLKEGNYCKHNGPYCEYYQTFIYHYKIRSTSSKCKRVENSSLKYYQKHLIFLERLFQVNEAISTQPFLQPEVLKTKFESVSKSNSERNYIRYISKPLDEAFLFNALSFFSFPIPICLAGIIVESLIYLTLRSSDGKDGFGLAHLTFAWLPFSLRSAFSLLSREARVPARR